ncbi:hypothetical protein SAMN04488072_106273 [Lentibacillus halodurans]|uniref:Uncharacterized protein n=1 Tax=Lentibacillus halodurans TaxID=237679 RepID=A0A1I0Y7Y6_9BACI|nr:hypothetical protein [Lentibacillus halodurans]SFB08600.1 hypothetical protein SAMN04488072_106273 [Lentibacillus halodurans]
MKNEIMKIINDLEKRFEKKGYYHLKGEITKKKNKFENRVNDDLNKSDNLSLLKQTFTSILVMIYRHIEMGEKHASKHLGMLDVIGDLFEKEQNYSNKQLEIENNEYRYSLEEIRLKYEGFKEVKGPIIDLIKMAKNK